MYVAPQAQKSVQRRMHKARTGGVRRTAMHSVTKSAAVYVNQFDFGGQVYLNNSDSDHNPLSQAADRAERESEEPEEKV